MQLFLLACAGGAMGAGLRHLANLTAVRTMGLEVAWATLTVNIVGSLVMGGLFAFLYFRWPDAAAVRIFFATGVLGGFTTFSAFSLDALIYLERGALGMAMAYIIGSVVLSIGACLAGYLCVRTILS